MKQTFFFMLCNIFQVVNNLTFNKLPQLMPMNSTPNSPQQQKNSNAEQSEIDSAFDAALEELAAELEITVDYYMMEFM
jgi:hypothetical protein